MAATANDYISWFEGAAGGGGPLAGRSLVPGPQRSTPHPRGSPSCGYELGWYVPVNTQALPRHESAVPLADRMRFAPLICHFMVAMPSI